jgi:hypothetical protein
LRYGVSVENGAASNGHPVINWAALAGRWEFKGSSAQYVEGSPGGITAGKPLALGIAVSSLQMQDGIARIRVNFSELRDEPQAAGLVVGYQSNRERYVQAQLGASDAAYSLSEWDPDGFGWRPLVGAGLKSNLESGRGYLLEVKVVGQKVRISVDGVKVIDHILSGPLAGPQVGLSAAGGSPVSFSGFELFLEQPRVFVAMQFGEPFDTIYRDVVRPEGDKLHLRMVRGDELAGPGIIFEDVKRQIAEAKVVIAEITAPNRNVFYELGYAHALNKPTILLAQRGKELPFDIRSYRVIFYDDSIGGKAQVEHSLDQHLRAVLQDDA